MSEDADAAAEIGALAREFRQMVEQQCTARVDAVPRKQSGLRPEAEVFDEARCAFGNGFRDG